MVIAIDTSSGRSSATRATRCPRGLAEAGSSGVEEFATRAARGHATCRRPCGALELSLRLAEGHSRSGRSLLFDWDWTAAETSFHRAVELRADYSLAHTWYAVFLMARGRHDEAIAQSQLAAELDPLVLAIQALIGQCHHFAGRFDEALVRHRSTLDADPATCALLWSSRTHRVWAAADALPAIETSRSGAGRPRCRELGTVLARPAAEPTHAILGELNGMKDRRYVSPFCETAIYGALGMEEECRRGFARMEEARSGIIPFLGDPVWYLETGWFRDLLRRTGVAAPS